MVIFVVISDNVVGIIVDVGIADVAGTADFVGIVVVGGREDVGVDVTSLGVSLVTLSVAVVT